MRKSMTAAAVLATLAVGACGGSSERAQPSVSDAFQKYGAIQDKFEACTAGLSTSNAADVAAYNACVDEANAAKKKVDEEEGIS